MSWLHSIDIHLVIAAFSFGCATGLALSILLFWRKL